MIFRFEKCPESCKTSLKRAVCNKREMLKNNVVIDSITHTGYLGHFYMKKIKI